LVTTNSRLEAVEEKNVVRVRWRLMNEVRERALAFQAVSKPPRDPFASTQEKSEREGGRKVCVFTKSEKPSLVSWMQAMSRRAEASTSRTVLHLSASPSPRTFQETT
jgi:hypothetical protein